MCGGGWGRGIWMNSSFTVISPFIWNWMLKQLYLLKLWILNWISWWVWNRYRVCGHWCINSSRCCNCGHFSWCCWGSYSCIFWWLDKNVSYKDKRCCLWIGTVVNHGTWPSSVQTVFLSKTPKDNFRLWIQNMEQLEPKNILSYCNSVNSTTKTYHYLRLEGRVLRNNKNS